jgi:hypothetical protein
MTEVFQGVIGNYRGLAGGNLFFNILVQNVIRIPRSSGPRPSFSIWRT